MRDTVFNGLPLADKDVDKPLEQTIALTSLMFDSLLHSAPSIVADAGVRLGRLFRTVLTRHICSGSTTDRPMMRRFREEWLRLANALGVAIPTVAYHCWCSICSDEGTIAPADSLQLCGRCRIASCASVLVRAPLTDADASRDCLRRSVTRPHRLD